MVESLPAAAFNDGRCATRLIGTRRAHTLAALILAPLVLVLAVAVAQDPVRAASGGNATVSAHDASHGVGPVTTGWHRSGPSIYEQSNQISAGWFNNDPTQGVVAQIFSGDQGGEAIDLFVPGGVPTVGTTYTNGPGVRIYVWDPSSIVCDTANGDDATARVDQLGTSQGKLTSLAISYSCGTASGRSYTGAFGWNMTPTTPHVGYYVYQSSGLITGYGNDNFLTYFGDLSAQRLNAPIVGMAQTSDAAGYWMAASDGGIFDYGDAGFYGSAGNIHLNEPVVGMAATPDGGGYWLVASDGGIFNYGDAGFFGSAGSVHLNRPIVGMAPTPSGRGYWLVASDGGIFSYGDAQFYGSTGNIHLNKPIVGMAASPSGHGYWLVASDGGIFSYGDTQFHGSTGGIVLNRPIVGMTATPSGNGYWFTASDGGIFSYGDATYDGSLPGDGVSVQDVAGLSA